MQAKIGDSIAIIGNATKDAELKTVGEKNSPLTKFSVAINRGKDAEPVYVNCVAWYRMAHVAQGIRKGDPCFVIGKLESREYNGKPYTDLVCEWVDFRGETVKPQPVFEAAQVAFDEMDDELPF